MRSETKYLVSHSDAARIKEKLLLVMKPDSYSENGSYRVRSLYFDTPDLADMFDKDVGVYSRKKVRLRIYDTAQENAKLELKGTEEIFRTEIPEAEIIGVASNDKELDALLKKDIPELLLLDLGLGGSTTVGVDICRRVKADFPEMKVLVFTGELLNEKLWVEVLDAGADGITLKTGELLTKHEIYSVMAGKKNVFNQPVLEKIVGRFREAVMRDAEQRKSVVEYEIDRYDECFLRHLALGYTKEMIASLKTMPFGVKSLEKRQADLISRLFPDSEQRGINVTRLVVRAIELHIIDSDNLESDE